MRIPRDLSGRGLVAALKKLGYFETRQTGSHIRVTTDQNGTHHVTVPSHDSLKLGTLSAILADVAKHHHLTREDLLKKLGL